MPRSGIRVLMKWETLRKMFGKARPVGWDKRLGRRMMNKTYAYLYNEDQTNGEGKSDERIEIELFTKNIIIRYPDEEFIVNNHDYWKSQCTRDRFRSLLPDYGSISSWMFKEHTTYKNPVGESNYAWAFWRSGYGSKIWKNGVVYDANCHRKDLTEALNTVNANELLSNIREYANATVKALYIDDLPHCSRCYEYMVSWKASGDAVMETAHVEMMRDHVLEHVMKMEPTFGVMWVAARQSKRPMHVQAVELLQRRHWPLWKYSRTMAGHAARVQQRMLHPELAFTVHPSHFRKTLRWNVSEMLLNLFGFSYGTSASTGRG